MKINEIIYESRLPLPDNIIESIATKIVNKCNPFLQQSSITLPIWRGVETEQDEVVNKYVTRPVRQSLAMSKQCAGFVDKWLYDNKGARFRTEHIVFGVGDYWYAEEFTDQVGGFGSTVAIIPIGEFKFCWSPFIQDINHKLGAARMSIDFDYIESVLVKANYQTSDLDAAIQSRNEIMIQCHEYYGLNVPIITYQKIINLARTMI